MARSRRRVISTTAAVLMGASFGAPTDAADIEQTERLTYAAMLGGLHVADLLVTLDQSEAGYSSQLKVVSRGVVRWVENFSADITGRGDFIESSLQNGTQTLMPLPDRFHRQWTGGEYASEMIMNFHPDTREAVVEERLFNPVTGEDLAQEDMPWNQDDRDDDDDDKPVPEDLRKNVLDPMGAFIAARRQIMAQGGAAGPAKNFRVPIYDGRRRYDIVGRTAPVRSTNIKGEEVAVVPVTTVLEPVFGFRPRAQERMRDTDSRLYFSADGRFIPIQFMMASDMFAAVINLENDCSKNATPCETFGQEPGAAP